MYEYLFKSEYMTDFSNFIKILIQYLGKVPLIWINNGLFTIKILLG